MVVDVEVLFGILRSLLILSLCCETAGWMDGDQVRKNRTSSSYLFVCSLISILLPYFTPRHKAGNGRKK